jgi:putative tricarboxylic transport membrane protein
MLEQIAYGFSVALTPMNLFYCFIGVLLGTLVGVLPGIGPVPTLSILLPITLKLPPVSAVIMLAGIYYGCQYGGSTTSILVNIPGEVTSVVTCIDGYQMALQGRAGPALGISAIGSFIGATISIAGILFLSQPLVKFALGFGPPEYFSLVFFSLMIVSGLAVESTTLKCLLMAALGMLVGVIGMDVITARPRFTFGIRALSDGVGIVPVIMGLYGVAEVLSNLEEDCSLSILSGKIERILPSLKDWAESKWAILRGTVIGFACGLIPGGGPIVATFASYAIEKKVSRHPERFGHGAIEGVAGPETANNAGAQSSFIPLLSLGIPPNVVMAIFVGALMIHGIQPGPLMMTEHPDLFWGVITSMYVGNAMLLVLNLPLIGVWVQILRIPYGILFPLILLFCFTGVFSASNSAVDIYVMVFFGLVGFIMRKMQYDPAPFVMGLVLSPIMESAFRQSLTISDGRLSIFVSRPISAVLLGMGILVMIGYLFQGRFRKVTT